MKHRYEWDQKDQGWESAKILDLILPHMADNVDVEVTGGAWFNDLSHYSIMFECDDPMTCHNIEQVLWLIIQRVNPMLNVKHFLVS